MRVGIIGGGVAGLAAAYHLTKEGHFAEVFEQADFLGGQASTFDVFGGRLERGYHHLFVSDTEITELIHELGLGDKLAWLESSVGFYHGGKIWDFASPMDLLKFKPLPILSRFRVGLWTLLLQKTKSYRKFEGVTAKDWLSRRMGRKGYEVIWEPLLRGKFGEFYDKIGMTWIWNKVTLRVASRKGAGQKEHLGYPMGSFGEVIEALAERGATMFHRRSWSFMDGLPEVGEPEKPRLVFFFDEAHLLFEDAPKALTEKVEQVVKLIRSKGVGIYFVTQNPLDIPDDVLSQLGNRIQHALRSFTPRDQKAVRAAAQTFRSNPHLDTEKAITEMGVGEALVSMLEDKGTPGIVERTLICPPTSRIGPVSDSERATLLKNSPLAGRYDTVVDRQSAHEKLQARSDEAAKEAEKMPPKKKGRGRQSIGEAMAKSVARAIGSQLGRQIVRGILGSMFKGR
jgi:hypothetical protein